HGIQRETRREVEQHRNRARRCERGQPGVRDPLRETDVDVKPERGSDLVLKELAQAAMLRVHAPQELAFVESEGEGMIRLPRPRLPRGFLTRQDDRKAIEVGDYAPIDGLVKGKQPSLVTEELADRDLLLRLLCELRPVPAYRRLVF